MKTPVLLLAIALCAWTFSCSQGGLLKKVKENKTVSNAMEGKKPITTNFKDVILDDKLAPDFGADNNYTSLHSMPQNEKGAYVLQPGFYEITNLSYCLKAGTHGPSKGDAYGLGFLKGKMADVVEVILLRSQEVWRDKTPITIDGLEERDTRSNVAEKVFNLSQKDVQVLLWAIIAKADFQQMVGRTKAVAVTLLTPQQLLKLNGGAVKTVSNFATDKGFLEKPAFVQRIEQAEQSIRQLYASGTGTYEDFERLAVLTGLATEPQPVEAGSWFKHKDGYYVRYEPMGYQRTTIKVYVPEGENVTFTATGTVATPSDTRQRLAQTDLAVEEYNRLGVK